MPWNCFRWTFFPWLRFACLWRARFPWILHFRKGECKKNINPKFQSMAFYQLPKTWSFLKIARLISLLFTTLSPSPSEGTTLQAKLRGRKIHQQLLVCLLLREGTGSFADFEKWNHHWIVLLLWEVLLHHNSRDAYTTPMKSSHIDDPPQTWNNTFYPWLFFLC